MLCCAIACWTAAVLATLDLSHCPCLHTQPEPLVPPPSSLQLILRLNKRGPLERGLFHNLRKKYAAICARLAIEVRY